MSYPKVEEVMELVKTKELDTWDIVQLIKDLDEYLLDLESEELIEIEKD